MEVQKSIIESATISRGSPLFKDLLTKISSPAFGLNAFALSSEQQVLAALADEPVLQEIVAELKGDSDKAVEVVRYAQQLAKEGSDPNYRHPHDSALLSLLLALHLAGDIVIRPLADEISTLPNGWFSRKLAMWAVDHCALTGHTEARTNIGVADIMHKQVDAVLSIASHRGELFQQPQHATNSGARAKSAAMSNYRLKIHGHVADFRLVASHRGELFQQPQHATRALRWRRVLL